MKALYAYIAAVLCCCLPAVAGNPGHASELERAILLLTGASSLEELDEDCIDRYLSLAEHPLKLNLASRSRLLSSGLLSAYRAASLSDYRQHYGDVLSFTELSAVNGFGEEFCEALKPFVSLESKNAPGSVERHRAAEHEMTLRSSLKAPKEARAGVDWSLSGRYSCSFLDRFEAGIAFKEAYGVKTFPPQAAAGYFVYDGPGMLSRVVAGAFNCRFGQGLTMWSGFSPSGLSRTSGLSRNPCLTAVYRGYDSFSKTSTAMTGAAATIDAGSTLVSVFAAHPGLAGMNSSTYFRFGQVGFTAWARAPSVPPAGAPPADAGGTASNSRILAYWSSPEAWRESGECRAGVDFRFNLKGWDIFGETAFDCLRLSTAAVAGLRYSPASWATFALLARYYPLTWTGTFTSSASAFSTRRDEHGAAMVWDFRNDRRTHSCSVSTDLAYRPSKRGLQSKSSLLWHWKISEIMYSDTRADFRWRGYEKNPVRAELRTDFCYDDGMNRCRSRLDAVYSTDFAYLCYAEYMRNFLFKRNGRLSLCLRQGAFHADSWADRIYCYSIDVPGSFNVPAMYGRGFWTTLLCGVKAVGRSGGAYRVYVYANLLTYPRKGEWAAVNDGRQAKIECRLQFTADIRQISPCGLRP